MTTLATATAREPDTTVLDAVVMVALLLGTFLYLSRLPHNLGTSDEAYFLVEAKRVAGGEVMYRDIFEFIPPGAVYIMAAAFRLFGTTMEVARNVTAIFHAIAAVLLSVTCRHFALARPLAAVVPLGYVALCQSAWPYASWHWFSSFLLVMQCWVLCRTRWTGSLREAFIPGLVSGASIGVQHQRGLPVALGVGVLLILLHIEARRWHRNQRWSTLVGQLATYVAGMACILVPLMLPSLWLAGLDALIEGMIRFPFETYRPTFRTVWGAVGPLTKDFAPYTMPLLLRNAPLVLVVVALRILFELVRAGDERAVQRYTAVLVLSLSAIASVWYYADFIHVAFVAAVFFVAAGASLAWLVQPLRRWPLFSAAMALLIAVACAAPLGGQLQRNYARAWTTYKVSRDTAFGRVDFATKWEPVLIDATREALAQVPGAELFAYPTLAAPYLTSGGKNPTRYQFFDARAMPKRYGDEVVQILQTRRVEFLVVSYAYLKPDDPIAQLLKTEYEAVPIPALPLTGEFPTTLLYRRKAELRSAAAPS